MWRALEGAAARRECPLNGCTGISAIGAYFCIFGRRHRGPFNGTQKLQYLCIGIGNWGMLGRPHHCLTHAYG
jgi:hypothetical protein